MGAVALVAIMPLHALLSVSAGHFLGHQSIWQSWKEVLLIIMTLAAVYHYVRHPRELLRFKRPVPLAILSFMTVSLLVTAVAHPSLVTAVFGIKTDLEFLVAFLLIYGFSDQAFKRLLAKILLISSGVVIGFGMLQIYVLPHDFLTVLGYGPTTISPFQSVDPAIGSVRIISTLGGANQLGSFLILPLAIVFWKLVNRPRIWQVVYILAGVVVEWNTFSRSALLGLAVAFAILMAAAVKKSWRYPVLLVLALIGGLSLQLLITASGTNNRLQYYLFHQGIIENSNKGSTDQHSLSLNAGINEAKTHPLGEGLGAAGPASFHGTSAFIPENYYLQIAIETGLLGLITYLISQLILALGLLRRGTRCSLGAPLLGALAGIAVVNLFLHGWADSSTALTFWTIAGATVGDKA